MASIYFDLLEEIQLALSNLVYVKKVNKGAVLTGCLQNFDRIDSDDERERLLNEIKQSGYKLNFEAFSLEQINNLFKKIKDCKDLTEAKKYFEILDVIHSKVAKIICVEKIEVPDALWKFFRDFDRMDQLELLFNDIKNRGYSL